MRGLLNRKHVSMLHFLLCLCILQAVKFSQKLKMTVQDLPNKQFGHSITAKLLKDGLFWKLSKKFGFHRYQCKTKAFYGYTTQSSKPNSFIHGVCSVLSFYAVFAFQNCMIISRVTYCILRGTKTKFRRLQ